MRRVVFTGVQKLAASLAAFGVFMLLSPIAWADNAAVPGYCEQSLRQVDFGAWSLLPAALAVIAAFIIRRMVLSLLLGLLAGSLLAWGVMPHTALYCGVKTFIWGPLSDPFNLQIIAFTFAVVGLLQVMTRSGGVGAILDHMLKWATSARRARLTTAAMGLFFFFDDYANTVVVGSAMRPVTDRHLVSREKLAWIVDSTSAPVAGLALISTWIAFEVGILQELVVSLELPVDGYSLFLMALPYRFYCIAALVAVFVSSGLSRDWGPMLRAERRATSEGLLLREGATPLTGAGFEDEPEPSEGRVIDAAVPLALLLVVMVAGLVWSGWSSVLEGIDAGVTSGSLLSLSTWRLAVGGADIALVLLVSSLVASVFAIALPARRGSLKARDGAKAWLRALPLMKVAVTVLVLAWGIKAVCDRLNTSEFLVTLLSAQLPVELFPLAVFLLSGLVAYGTGTSWGAMAIVLPIAVPVAHAISPADAGLLWVILSSAAVLDGAIFGDHCSPISDTTVLSSAATACDHMDHVKTQAPYAVMSMIIAATVGYLLAAYGAPPALSWSLLIALTIAVFFVVGRALPERPRADMEPSAAPEVCAVAELASEPRGAAVD